MALSSRNVWLVLLICLILFTCRAHAFGAGNIASISAVEGKNWRHGDIEDILKTLSCIRHHKWNSMMMKRVYFGNWLRDYSQAMDTGALKKAAPETIRVLVWLLSFLSFGYATAEFEVTTERLGVYRPEEHIDNPKDYNDNEDARQYDPRLRGPVRDIELQIDPETGMKNYIANGKGDWATSLAFVKYSFERSIHHGRLYTNGRGIFKGKDEDLAEALRYLGQGLHTLEDFGAHTNYVELVLRDMGFNNVFPLVGSSTAINLRGKHVFPLVTGTFGMVDFYHSVLGEATDHFTQSEINEMDNALGVAQQAASSSNPLTSLVSSLSKIPGTSQLCAEAAQLQRSSEAQARSNAGGYSSRGVDDYGGSSRGVEDWQTSRSSQPGFPSYGNDQWNAPQQQGWDQPQGQWQGSQGYQSQQGFPGAQQDWQQPAQHQGWQQQQQPPPPPQQHQGQNWETQQGSSNTQTASRPAGLEGMPDFDPAKTVAQIYPILAFRDKVVRTISSVIEKIPGLEALVDRITETLTVFILSLLAPIVRPIINAMSKTLKVGSEGVINSSGKHQYEVWTDPHSSDPTHSMLSKDHFSNILNEPAGNVAAEILKYIAPRVLYAWEHASVPVDQVMNDIECIFHHPAIRNERNEAHRNMYAAVKNWVHSLPDRGRNLENVLSSEGVRAGKNHKGGVNEHAHLQSHSKPPQQQSHQSSGGSFGGLSNLTSFLPGQSQQGGGGSHSSSNPLGSVGSFIDNFTGSGHQQGRPQHGSSGGGGLSDMLSMASKLPIPGVKNINKYTKFMGGLGGSGGGTGRRGLDGDDDDDNFTGSGGSELGGSRELHEAATHANVGRSPSPQPLSAPPGYEQYDQQDYGGYGPQEDQGQQPYQHQYQTAYQDPYQNQNQYGGGGGQYGGGGQHGGHYGAPPSGGYGGHSQGYYQS
ncbi:hypothetical protein PV10_05137 [Exophiala mesophila]|uniref:Het-C-domain-containing protein n=1 Tax=Exophiala mesophila TaxID=212818 RepID=A0A0D1ZJ75_EXOME|nr:uncharacterized protein PV10_05137 [Exophiala mesophila]KIV93969.1 hypothetical protein PV10_05137 [Exophiala mesophila]